MQYYNSYPQSIQIESNRIIVYPARAEFDNFTRKKTAANRHDLSIEKNKTKGVLSRCARLRMSKCIRNFLQAIETHNQHGSDRYKRFITFATLTLPAAQMHSDKILQKILLDRFIIYAKRKLNLTHYVWRAEKQKNGNLHWHILCDTYIHYKQLRGVWNNILKSAGYIDKFEEKHGHKNPNSTDIHALKSIDNVEEYVLKYCTKNEDVIALDCRLWGCSDELRKLRAFSCLENSDTNKLLNDIAQDETSRVVQHDDVFIIYAKKIEHKLVRHRRLYLNYIFHHIRNFNYLYKPYLLKKNIYEQEEAARKSDYQPYYLPVKKMEKAALEFDF